MSAPKLVITSVLTTLTVIIFTAVLAASALPGGAIAHGGWQGGKHFGGHFGGHRGGLEQRCERLSDDHTRMAGAMASAYLDLSDAQEQALSPVLTVLDNWRVETKSLCDQVASAEQHDVALGLATMERFMTSGAAAMTALQPAYRDFEASLDASQREKIANALNRHHRAHTSS